MTRLLDILMGLAALAVLAPVGLLVGVLNWLFARRVLFRQVRLGRGLRPFVMLKFQTMVDGSSDASTVTVAGDPRLTPIGKALRALKLDELPQLINVVRGEMSLVGPRALPPNEVSRIPPALARQVYSVRPGMTGLATLLLTDEERLLRRVVRAEEYYFREVLPRKMLLESVYVERKTVWFDLLILALTPLSILSPGLTGALLRAILGSAVPASFVRSEGGPL